MVGDVFSLYMEIGADMRVVAMSYVGKWESEDIL
jgi:hypothetical protein